jgi:hypothetical protein
LRRDHIAIGVINRFDMAPANGANCGQYRVIFAKRSSSAFDRLHLIFEPVLPNPEPSRGLAGCRPVAQFWADLSAVSSIAERRARLERFFFSGLDGFAPVLHPDHLSVASGGGIRTMHNSGDLLANRFYQFHLEKRGDHLVAEPGVLENMPPGTFFDATNSTPAAKRFREVFVANVRNLATEDENLASMNIPREFLLAESNPGGSELDVIFEIPFITGRFSAEGIAFSSRISAELRKAGSRLSPLDAVTRANHLSCTGCHFFRGNVGGTEFYQQISESFTEPGEAGPRFKISSTMRDVFVPHRAEVLRNFLKSTAPR